MYMTIPLKLFKKPKMDVYNEEIKTVKHYKKRSLRR